MSYNPSPYPWLTNAPPPQITPEIAAAMERYLNCQGSATTAPLSQVSLTPSKSLVDRIHAATQTARKAIEEGKLTKATQLQWAARLRDSFKTLYGEKSPFVVMLNAWVKEITKSLLPTDDFLARAAQIDHFVRAIAAPGISGAPVMTSQPSLTPATKNVFVIHGHDEANQLRLRHFLSDDFRLTPILLLDKPGRSAPTAQKFEEYAATCSYAIALFTADDQVTNKAGDTYWQPRPNVVYETGWFVGRLGRERVLILLQEGVRIYSDFDGVNRVHFRSDIEEKFRSIRAELEAAKLIATT